MKIKGTYTVHKWEEIDYEQISSEMKMTKASVEYLINGEIEGKAHVEYLMFYTYFDSNDPHKSSAVYTGLMKFEGKLQEKEGIFVIEDRGTFENGLAGSSLKIIKSSGLSGLKGIEGSGQYSASKDGAYIELDFTL